MASCHNEIQYSFTHVHSSAVDKVLTHAHTHEYFFHLEESGIQGLKTDERREVFFQTGSDSDLKWPKKKKRVG